MPPKTAEVGGLMGWASNCPFSLPSGSAGPGLGLVLEGQVGCDWTGWSWLPGQKSLSPLKAPLSLGKGEAGPLRGVFQQGAVRLCLCPLLKPLL